MEMPGGTASTGGTDDLTLEGKMKQWAHGHFPQKGTNGAETEGSGESRTSEKENEKKKKESKWKHKCDYEWCTGGKRVRTVTENKGKGMKGKGRDPGGKDLPKKGQAGSRGFHAVDLGAEGKDAWELVLENMPGEDLEEVKEEGAQVVKKRSLEDGRKKDPCGHGDRTRQTSRGK